MSMFIFATNTSLRFSSVVGNVVLLFTSRSQMLLLCPGNACLFFNFFSYFSLSGSAYFIFRFWHWADHEHELIYIYIFFVFVVGFGLRSRQCASCTIAGNSRWGHSKIDCSVLDHTGEWIIIMERIIERFAIRHGHLPNETTVFQGFVMSVVQNTLKKMYLNSFGSCLFFLLSLNKIKNSANYRRTAILRWHTNAESHYCCSSVRSGSSPFFFFFLSKMSIR